jgi:hypothetical protein
MKRITILLICLFGWLMAYSQSGTSPYFYEEFRKGKVFFTEGNPVEAIFNYSFVLEEMQFLDPEDNDQILTLVRRPNMTHIEIGRDIFVPVDRQGWALVLQDGPVTLLQKKHIIPLDKKGPYGVPLNTSGAQIVSNLGSVMDASYILGNVGGGQARREGSSVFDRSAVGLSQLQLENVKTEIRHWLMRDQRVFPATRQSFLRVYSEVRPQLERFFEDNRVDFGNEQHLRSLTRYANSLLATKQKYSS